MADLKLYDVEINGFRTTIQLTEADAAARGLTARPEASRAAEPAPAKAPAKSRRASNKARTAENKAE
jgi:hypothetical protein